MAPKTEHHSKAVVAKPTKPTAVPPKAAEPAPAQASFVLPVMIVGPADLGRLQRELETLDDSLLQLGLRQGGKAVELPQTSHLMEQAAHLNKLNLLQAADRQGLRAELETIRTQAPLLHISFSADPTAAFIEKLMDWLRREIHPQVLLTIGLQPNIGAGCIVRSTNKYFDCSLRQGFSDKRALLLEKLATATPPAATPPVQPVATTGGQPT